MVMAFWELNDEQESVVGKHVKGKAVLDVMAGDCSLSYMAVSVGASRAIAVDSMIDLQYDESPMVSCIQCQLHDYVDSGLPRPKIMLLSWPPNTEESGLLELLDSAEVVVYIGKCVDGTVCGTDNMWKLLTEREILDHSPSRRNTLTVYGPKTTRRPLTGEEIAATRYSSEDAGSISFEEAERLAAETISELV